MTLALVDGDIVAYRAASACQTDYDWGPQGGGKVSAADAQRAASMAVSTVAAWQALAGASDVLVAFTGKNNWRKRVLPSYKASRAGKVKPRAYYPTVEAVTQAFPTRVVDGLEADDIMGILLSDPRYADHSVCVTIDKDLRTVPGRHLNPLKNKKSAVVSVAEADYRWLTQALTGDTSDGYVGIPGIGPKRAEAILKPNLGLPDMWARVVAAFKAAHLTEADALVQARVARILRREDYDTPNKEILLWHPTTPTRLPLLEPP